jgi:hypothetical protein
MRLLPLLPLLLSMLPFLALLSWLAGFLRPNWGAEYSKNQKAVSKTLHRKSFVRGVKLKQCGFYSIGAIS